MVEQNRAAEEEARLQAELNAQAAVRAPCKPTKTYAQQLLEVDQDDEELFALIADEIHKPTWLTPILCEFPQSLHPHATSRPLPCPCCVGSIVFRVVLEPRTVGCQNWLSNLLGLNSPHHCGLKPEGYSKIDREGHSSHEKDECLQHDIASPIHK